MLNRNLQYTEAAFASLAMDVAADVDFEKILKMDAECTAVKLPGEIRHASRKLVTRLIKIFHPMSEIGLVEKYRAAI